jgi:hypothetical protein
MFLGSRARPVRRADNLATICEPIVQAMWDPQHFTTLWASKACYFSYPQVAFTAVRVQYDTINVKRPHMLVAPWSRAFLDTLNSRSARQEITIITQNPVTGMYTTPEESNIRKGSAAVLLL